jgi:hypothetical protein
MGDDPRDRDSDDDGVEDGDELAGTVQSFDASTGVLTIALAGGGTQSGAVTDATRIECEDEDAELRAASDGDGGESGDDRDNSGPGSTSSGPGRDGDGDRGDDDAGDDADQDDNDEDCTTADLTAGRVVHEAKLRTNAAGDPVFTKVELDG